MIHTLLTEAELENHKAVIQIKHDKQKALASWQKIIQTYSDKNDDVRVKMGVERMESVARNYDVEIQSMKDRIIRDQIKEMEHKKKILDLCDGNQTKELFDGVFGNGNSVRGYVQVSQFDETKIINEFTTFKEFLETGCSWWTCYRPNELKEKKAHFGSVLYCITSNGMLKKIDANYDSSD